MSQKIIYVCSPFRGNEKSSEAENIESAKKYSKYVMSKGDVPITPHLLYPQILNDNIESERKLGIACGLEIMKLCDEVHVFGNIISAGMICEIKYAKKIGKIIRKIDLNQEIQESL